MRRKNSETQEIFLSHPFNSRSVARRIFAPCLRWRITRKTLKFAIKLRRVTCQLSANVWTIALCTHRCIIRKGCCCKQPQKSSVLLRLIHCFPTLAPSSRDRFALLSTHRGNQDAEKATARVECVGKRIVAQQSVRVTAYRGCWSSLSHSMQPKRHVGPQTLLAKDKRGIRTRQKAKARLYAVRLRHGTRMLLFPSKSHAAQCSTTDAFYLGFQTTPWRGSDVGERRCRRSCRPPPRAGRFRTRTVLRKNSDRAK